MLQLKNFVFFALLLSTSLIQAEPMVLLDTLGGEPTYLNPVLATDQPSQSVAGNIFSGLFRVNPNLELEPDVAESYEISPDGRTYTFKLKQNVKFQDGHSLTAEDVVFTFQIIQNPKTNTVRRSNYIIEGKPIVFKAIDKYTVQAILPQPFAPFLVNVAMGILPKHLLEKEDINTAKFNRNPVGAGPFKFKEWKAAEYIRLERNPHYFGKAPKLDGILYKIIPEERTEFIALKKGEIDTGRVPRKDFESFKKNTKVNVFRFQDLMYVYMGFNLKNPLFADLRVRRAIAHSINKPALVRGVLKGLGLPAEISCAPVLWSYPETGVVKFEYDVKKGKKLLEEAGFILNPKTKILEKDGKPFEFTLLTNKGNKDRELSAQVIQRFLQEVGIKMNIQVMEWSTLIKKLNENIDPKKFDAVLLGWGLSLDPDDYEIWHSSQYPKGFNFIAYKNATVDANLSKGRLETDRTKRKEIYKTIYNEIAQDVPYIFLYYPDVISGINKRVKGLSKPGPAGLMNPIENVYIAD